MSYLSGMPDDPRLDARRFRRVGPRVTLTFKVSRRVVRGLIWIAEQRDLRANATVAQLIAEETTRRRNGDPSHG